MSPHLPRRNVLRLLCIPVPVALAILALVPQAPAPAQQRAQQRTFTERTDVTVVEVPVQVMLGGEPVRGLTADDFVIVDGKERYRPIGFEAIDLALTSSGRYWTEEDQRQMPIAARRHFLLLFDLSFSRPDGILRAREGVQDLVRRGMHPADLAAVATYTESKGFQVVLNFTGDRPQILAAIETLGVMDPVDRFSRDPLGMVVADFRSDLLLSMIGERTSGEALTPGEERKELRQLVMLEALEDARISTIRTAREQQQQQIRAFASSLHDVARMLSEVDGRSHVVLLSEGFDSSAILGSSTEDRARIEEMRRAVEDGETWKVDNDERFGSSLALFGMTQMLDEFRHAGATIQAIDIGGLRAQGIDNEAARDSLVRQDGLFVLANDTGGQLYRNTNDLTDAMDEMLESTSVTYLLAYQPKNLAADGAFHPIEVRLDGGPKGARVLHRDGYYAPLPYSESSEGARRMQTAQLLLGGADGGALDLAALAAPFAGKDGRAGVSVLIEVDGPALLQGCTEDPLPAEVFAYALREDGSVADYFAHALRLHLDKVRATLSNSGFKFWGQLDLAPGEYRLRLLARNVETGAYGLATVPLTVRDTAARDAAASDTAATGAFLLTPLFPEPRGKWMLAREQGDSAPSGDPFVLRGESYLPAARPVLRRDVPSEMVLLGHGLDAASTRVEGQLYDAAGQLAGTPRVEVLAGSAGAEPGSVQLVASVRAGDVAPGRYTLRVAVGDGATDVSSTIEVEVE